MTDFNQFHDSLNIEPSQSKKIPDMLNVLTILSLIGCAIGLISAVYSFFTVCNSIQAMEGLSKLGNDNPMAGMMNSAMQSLQKQCELKLPILIINIVGVLLCFVGILQMRKLKKTGFFAYLIGEIVPPVAIIVISGSAMGGLVMLNLLVPIVFIVLYITQLKHLK